MRFKKLKKENKRLSEQQVLDWTVQLLSAVNYMHSRRVLHRDLKARWFVFPYHFFLFFSLLLFHHFFFLLFFYFKFGNQQKPRNIFLKNEIVKIGDFGISRILQGTMDMASTFTGTPYVKLDILFHNNIFAIFLFFF